MLFIAIGRCVHTLSHTDIHNSVYGMLKHLRMIPLNVVHQTYTHFPTKTRALKCEPSAVLHVDSLYSSKYHARYEWVSDKKTVNYNNYTTCSP